jgi:hypothetical protein
MEEQSDHLEKHGIETYFLKAIIMFKEWAAKDALSVEALPCDLTNICQGRRTHPSHWQI